MTDHTQILALDVEGRTHTVAVAAVEPQRCADLLKDLGVWAVLASPAPLDPAAAAVRRMFQTDAVISIDIEDLETVLGETRVGRIVVGRPCAGALAAARSALDALERAGGSLRAVRHLVALIVAPTLLEIDHVANVIDDDLDPETCVFFGGSHRPETQVALILPLDP